MATWAYVSKFLGIYNSPEFSIGLDGDGAMSTMSWVSTVPENTSLTLQVSISNDSGRTWGDWLTATNGGVIPHITTDMSLANLLIKFRALFRTTNPSISPMLEEINFRLEPIINFKNEGDESIFPEVFIEKIGNGDLKIINVSDGNSVTELTGLIDQEKVYLNGDKEQVETSLPLVYRYKDFNDNHLKMTVGENVLRIEGNAKIQFRYELKYLHGF